MDMKEVVKVIRDSGFKQFGIRHCCDDENYNIGDDVRNSYDWSCEYECSSYDTDEPVELDGACAYDTEIDCAWDTDEEIIEKLEKALKNSDCYSGSDVVLLGADDTTYGNDEKEIIMEYAEVLYKF